MDGRCHYAKTDTNGATITDSAGVTKPLDNNNPTTNTAHPGDTLTFRFHANTSDGSGAAQDIYLLNWANITMQAGLGTVSPDPAHPAEFKLLDPPGDRYDNWCLTGKDSKASYQVYSCSPGAIDHNTNEGKNVYSIQHLGANQNNSDDFVSFNLTISPAARGGTVCTRFHTSQFSTQTDNYTSASDLNAIAQAQYNGAGVYISPLRNGETGHEILPTWAASERWCVHIVKPQPTPQNSPSCAGAPDTYSGALGGSVRVTVNFTNESGTDWWAGASPGDVSPPSTPPYPGYSNNPTNGNDPNPPPAFSGTYKYYYPKNNGSYKDNAGNIIDVVDDGNWTTKRHDAVMTKGTDPDISTAQQLNGASPNLRNVTNPNALLGTGGTVARTFTITNGGALGPQVYYFSILNREKWDNGAGAARSLYAGDAQLCKVVINWQGSSIDQFDCQVTHVTGPGSYGYHLQFTDSAGNVVNYPATGSISGDLDTRPATGGGTFLTFGFMRPHLNYSLQVIADGVGPTGTPASLNYGSNCMDASCEVSIDTGGVIVEPGQSVSAKYGIQLENDTNKTFNDYSVVIAAQPGLSGGTTDNDPLAPGSAAHDGPFGMTANYGGYATADIYLGGTLIDQYFVSTAGGPPGCKSAQYNPQTRPTMKVTNGDISTGGGFAYQNACDLTTTFTGAGNKPRYVSPKSIGGTPNSGGLRTFANPGSFQGSGSDFAALALGYINGGKDGPYGFYSSGLSTGAHNYSSLNFANTTDDGGPDLGGLLGGQNTAAHCTPDYFNNTRMGVLTAQNKNNVQLNGYNTSQQVLLQNVGGGQPCIRLRGQLSAGVRLTIYTADDVCIDGDITYAPWSIDTTNLTNNAPYLSVITTGGIYVQPNVKTISGLFIAQPKDDGTGGVFTTCGNNNTVAGADYVAANCLDQLNTEGSIIAQHIYPVRVHDTLWKYTKTSDASEIFDYTPSSIVSQPNLAPICGGAAVDSCEENVISLPPLF